MRILGLIAAFAILASACTSGPSGDAAVTPSTELAPGLGEIAPPHEIMRVKTRSAGTATRRAAPDTRDRSKIPATDDLREAEILQQHGEWTVMRSKDAKTNEISCTAVHKQGGRIQLGSDGLYLNFKGNGGGVGSYRLSYDGKPAIGVRFTTPLDSIALKDLNKLKSTQRMRVSVQTVVRDNVELDLDLKGLRDAHNTLMTQACAS